MTAEPPSPGAPVSAQATVHDDVQQTLTIEAAERIVRRARILKRVLLSLVFGVGPVVALLLAIALPLMQQVRCRPHQLEAQILLRKVFAAEQTAHTEYGRYIDDLGILRLTEDVEKSRYWVNIRSVSSRAFLAFAMGKPGTEIAGDVWFINQNGTMKNQPYDGCAASNEPPA